MTGASHHEVVVTAAVSSCVPDGTRASCHRSSQPHACATAYSGALTMMNVTTTPRSSESTPTRMTLLSGAM